MKILALLLSKNGTDSFLPRQKLHATTFGPDVDGWRVLLPGTVAARFLWAACWSEAGLMGGNDGADMGTGVEGEGSGKESVAM